MKTPVELAAEVYEREECARTFREDLEAHLLSGYVFSTPELFLMARGVRHDAPRGWIVNPWHVFPDAEQDGWLVYLAAGRVNSFFTFMPRPMKFIGWERGNVLRFFPAKQVQRCCSFSSVLFSRSLSLSPCFAGASARLA